MNHCLQINIYKHGDNAKLRATSTSLGTRNWLSTKWADATHSSGRILNPFQFLRALMFQESSSSARISPLWPTDTYP